MNKCESDSPLNYMRSAHLIIFSLIVGIKLVTQLLLWCNRMAPELFTAYGRF